MKPQLINDFIVDKENSTVNVTREFAANKDLVWRTWTEPELLDKWWAPEPWKSVTKSMEFKEGERRLYVMVGPNGEEHWAFADYTSINPKDSFSFSDGFCDSDGNRNEALPGSSWMVNFSESEGVTKVYVEIKHETLEDLEKIIEMGFKEGFTACLEQLSELLNND
ncbi:MAG: SRPBCC domain-containing protein [Balneola sp.]|nr:SRPBCC domain-containing protein [Balneola sp.]MBO6650544.1 SRPBCC domain-containing protein [Balneola sp.]MBO6711541.1 SRPBCC domain-containing protein [Balneola sp.]MBO6799737.1 SRPBCC domain-containing protein [Balneola sp.]MBO6870822.1 SRPBCC domain-containing protein [Balneola sp.]